jgi:two-component system, chemotaxis family, CheB/CheR fusion protein
VSRRRVLSRINSLEAYADFVQNNPKELEALYADVLINVTNFFRDPAAFETLKERVFPKILAGSKDNPIRAWVVGCSSGEEAYSIGMALQEVPDTCDAERELQIFATDRHPCSSLR